MEVTEKCEHIWRKAGLWDGRTPDGKPTGGIMFKCDLCGEKVTTMQQIKEKGGSVVQDTDVFGKPLDKQKEKVTQN